VEPKFSKPTVPSHYGEQIDRLLPKDVSTDTVRWSDEKIADLKEWRQGDLVVCPSLFWATANQDSVGSEQKVDFELTQFENTGYGIIITQTCDIAVDGPGKNHPFVMVSPVYESRLTENHLSLTKSGEIYSYFYVKNPPVENAEYIADLRVALPIGKEILCHQDRRSAFMDEEDELDFGAAVSRKYGRAALSEKILDTLCRAIDRLTTTAGFAKKIDSGNVEQIRVEIVKGTRIAPTSLRLIVCYKRDVNPEEKKEWKKAHREISKAMESVEIDMEDMLVASLININAKTYRESVELRLKKFRPARHWIV
jgi:hypothetical protein